MAYKILILEGSWAEDDKDYMSDNRSVARIYAGIEALLSVHDEPAQFIFRPLLKSRFLSDLDQFLSLNSNRRGVNVVILSGHGDKDLTRDGKHRRWLSAIDETINLSIEIREPAKSLTRSVIVLDSCLIGDSVESFRRASGALGVVGFSKRVNWNDSAVFILALLLKFQSAGVFHLKRKSAVTPKRVLGNMVSGKYKSLAKSLGVEFSFDE